MDTKRIDAARLAYDKARRYTDMGCTHADVIHTAKELVLAWAEYDKAHKRKGV